MAPTVSRSGWLVAGALVALVSGCAQTGIDTETGSGGAGAPVGTGGFFVGGPGGSSPFGTGGEFFNPGTGGFSCDGSLPLAVGGSVGIMEASAPVLGAVTTAAEPPPPITGGTLLVLNDQVTAVASDPDRDQLYVVDIPSATLRATVPLQAGDQPGRLVEDGAGLVHVALRGGGAIATLDPQAGKVTQRRTACGTPRGIAYSAAKDLLYLACASGDLLAFTPTGTTPASDWTLPQDLRDVIVDGDDLMITRFRSAEALVVDDTGQIVETQEPATFSNPEVHQGTPFEPAVAWRAAPVPGGGMVMVHQRGMDGTVVPSAGGYGGLGPCDTIVHTAVCRMKRGEKPAAGPAMPGFVLPVDIAVSPDGSQVAMVAAGNGQASPGLARRLFITDMDDATAEWSGGCGMDERHGPTPQSCRVSVVAGTGGSVGGEMGSGGANGGPGTGGAVGIADTAAVLASASTGGATGAGGALEGAGGTFGGDGGAPGVIVSCGVDIEHPGEPVAVAYAGAQTVLVQIREPAQLLILTGVDSVSTEVSVSLSSESRADTGHALFHANSGGGLACASCHPEGHDDGRVWDFACEGSRRTQDPSGGLLGTEPFHWNGDMTDFPTLVKNVFVQRMSGPDLPTDQIRALQGWVDKLPELPPLRSSSDAQVMHGKEIFESPSVGCASCHTGAQLTNNATVSVGTGADFQVPSLRGVGWRGPYMHNGCAATLADRFTDATCGGGDQHGVTSTLSDSDRNDLIAYLQSL